MSCLKNRLSGIEVHELFQKQKAVLAVTHLQCIGKLMCGCHQNIQIQGLLVKGGR
jgi:hypothetical protein